MKATSMTLLLTTATLVLACSGGDAELPASSLPSPVAATSAPSTGDVTLATLPHQWTEVENVDGAWRFANGCEVNANLTVDDKQLVSGGCGGPISGSTPTPDGITITLTDENSGEPATATFRWVDRAAGVGEWAWPGCFVQPLPHMEYDRAAMLPKRTDPGCAGQ